MALRKEEIHKGVSDFYAGLIEDKGGVCLFGSAMSTCRSQARGAQRCKQDPRLFFVGVNWARGWKFCFLMPIILSHGTGSSMAAL